MNMPVRKMLIATIFLLSTDSHLLAQDSTGDEGLPHARKVAAALSMLEGFSSNEPLTAKQMLQIYRLEAVIGKFIWAERRDSISVRGTEANMFCHYLDSALGARCLLYVRSHSDRFSVVWDGWKGEENFVEPNRYWSSLAQRSHPNSPEANEIGFDGEFKLLIRRYDFDDAAKGKTCEQYCKEVIKDGQGEYEGVYAKEYIDQWPAECAATRERFQREREVILKKYGNAPFTKALRDIDISTVVVFHSLC